jgi:hypothetical protein
MVRYLSVLLISEAWHIPGKCLEVPRKEMAYMIFEGLGSQSTALAFQAHTR